MAVIFLDDLRIQIIWFLPAWDLCIALELFEKTKSTIQNRSEAEENQLLERARSGF